MAVRNPADSTGIVRILFEDGRHYESSCSEVEYRAAIASLGPIEYEVNGFGPNFVPFSHAEMHAPHGMITLSFNSGNNIISVHYEDIKRIYWELII